MRNDGQDTDEKHPGTWASMKYVNQRSREVIVQRGRALPLR